MGLGSHRREGGPRCRCRRLVRRVSDLEGVNAEAPSLEELLEKLPGVVLGACQHAGASEHRRLKGYGKAAPGRMLDCKT
jgi:hypothetical protein